MFCRRLRSSGNDLIIYLILMDNNISYPQLPSPYINLVDRRYRSPHPRPSICQPRNPYIKKILLKQDSGSWSRSILRSSKKGLRGYIIIIGVQKKDLDVLYCLYILHTSPYRQVIDLLATECSVLSAAVTDLPSFNSPLSFVFLPEFLSVLVFIPSGSLSTSLGFRPSSHYAVL